MIILFYVFSFIAILSTVCVIFNKNPIHALFYLVLSLLSVACVFFSLGSIFAGALEVIIYAGAIMVLFVFTIMMFDMKSIYLNFNDKEFLFLPLKICCGVILLMSSFLIVLLCNVFKIEDCFIDLFESSISLNQIGISLFGSYALVVEMASFLLLSSLISVLHMVQSYKIPSSFNLKKQS